MCAVLDGTVSLQVFSCNPLPISYRPAKILDTHSLHTAFIRALEILTQVLTVVQQVLLPSEPCLQYLQ